MEIKKKYIKTCALGLSICMLISLLTSCNQTQDTEQETTTLWVLTEISKTDGMNYQAEMIAEQFEAEHEGVTVQLEILPTDEEEREVYLKQLRTQIMAGAGPDVYLLPIGDSVETDMPGSSSQSRKVLEYMTDPLFRDVTQAMYNGVFADISQYYDSDTELHTEGLNKDVMDAGILDGCRYVLPLRYDMPVLFTDPSLSDDVGVSQTIIEDGIDALVENTLDKNDTLMAIGLSMPTDTSLLPTLFDYKKGEMLITEEEIADYMRLYQSWYALSAASTPEFMEQCVQDFYVKVEALEIPNVKPEHIPEMFPIVLTRESFLSHLGYIENGMHWSNLGFPLYSDFLPGALEQAAIARVTEKQLEAHPMRATDGSIVAEVTYYGAVGGGTENPELAYAFVRQFLTEEYQWDILRPRADRSNDTLFNLTQEVQNDGLVEDSWPVRAKGAAYYLWENWQYQLYYNYTSFIRESVDSFRKLKSKDLIMSDEDMPVLDYAIDEVRFPITQDYEDSLEYALSLLNNEDGTPTDVDIDALAKEVYTNLWWHLAEG